MKLPAGAVLVVFLVAAASLPARTGEVPAPEELPDEPPREPTRQEPAPKPEAGAGEEGAVVTIEPVVEAPVPPAEAVPEAPIEAAPPVPIARRGGFGVRAGVLLPAAGETADHDAAAILGLTYSPGCQGDSKLSYELGVDYARTEAPDTGVLSNVGIARADLLYAPGGPTGIPYLLAGVEGILTGTGSETSYAGAVNVGVGLGLAGGRLDLRVTQSMLMGSTNVQELTVVTLGARF